MHHHQVLAGILALSGAAAAFSDSSPWALLSTSSFPNALNANQIQSSSQVLKYTKDILSECPTDRYLVVSQPGLRAADLRHPNDCALPHFCRAVQDSRVRGKYTVSEVIGELTDAGLSDHIKTACAKKGKTVKVDELRLASLSADDRVGSLSENDGILAKHLKTTADSDSFTLLLLSTPREPSYEPDFDEPLRMDLKRRQDASSQRRGNKSDWDKLPLFAKYQFFTPGIFMAIITAIVLLSILGVGIRALGSLEVSYGAFEKEMGPAAQKKNQ
ncbi:hypothetical protein PT974_06602 [Cladobotryum mycophilum]|uniref:Protein BIG1 n=1 Tax=Cladobotryum mycophilum TaxID=491253 RepID=A0ABR0SLZ1_9HYPO